jgi:hypothetical protein
VATRSRQAGDETLGDWIGASRHDDRDRAGCLFRGLYQRVRPGRDDDIDLRSDQLLGEIVEQLNIQFRGAILDGDRLAFDPAQLAKTGEERSGEGVSLRGARTRYPRRGIFGGCCASAGGKRPRLTARMTASPINRMDTSVGLAGESLAERYVVYQRGT